MGGLSYQHARRRLEEFKVGDNVTTKDSQEAIVVHVNEDGTYDIHYYDGNVSKGFKKEHLRLMKEESSSSEEEEEGEEYEGEEEEEDDYDQEDDSSSEEEEEFDEKGE